MSIEAAARVRLDPMTWDEFDPWAERSVRGFAARLVAARLMSSQDADVYARQQLAELLPSGIATPLHLLRTVREIAPGEPGVGHLWVRVGPAQPPAAGVEAYVFDIELVEDARGRGLGTATMLAAEQVARDLGAESIRLTVFGRDGRARRMYERLGYLPAATATGEDAITAQLMTKAL